jgi:hypothetical protein
MGINQYDLHVSALARKSSHLNQEIRCLGRSAADDKGRPYRRDDDGPRRDNRMSDHPACDTPGVIRAGRAYDGARFHSAQGGEAT